VLREHRRREPAPNVFRLVLPLPFPGLDRVNAYVLGGDEPVLVDCGMYLPDDAEGDKGWSDVVGALATCELEPTDVKRLVITHPHIDHYGMAARFAEQSGCELVMHASAGLDLEMYRDPAGLAEKLRSMFRDHGVTDEAELQELTAFEDWRRFLSGVVESGRSAEDGDTFEAGGRTWTIVHTPGHAHSHICLWAEADRVLISGDHLLPTITPHIDFKRGEDDDPLGDFLESLGKVEKLDPAMVLPGHGHPFEEGAERARVVQRHHDRRLGSILQVIRRQPCTAEKITEEIFGGELLNFQKRLALGEALAHLAYLRRRGEVERFEQDGTFLYRKVSRRPSMA
jgi:glyoxylase-like metal-dependent hydrolase (beta-lactamase superfamily II)